MLAKQWKAARRWRTTTMSLFKSFIKRCSSFRGRSERRKSSVRLLRCSKRHERTICKIWSRLLKISRLNRSFCLESLRIKAVVKTWSWTKSSVRSINWARPCASAMIFCVWSFKKLQNGSQTSRVQWDRNLRNYWMIWMLSKCSIWGKLNACSISMRPD